MLVLFAVLSVMHVWPMRLCQIQGTTIAVRKKCSWTGCMELWASWSSGKRATNLVFSRSVWWKNGTVLLKICLYIFCEQPNALHLELLVGSAGHWPGASFWIEKREKGRTENPIHFFNLCFQKVAGAIFGAGDDSSALALFQHSCLATQELVSWFFFPLVS